MPAAQSSSPKLVTASARTPGPETTSGTGSPHSPSAPLHAGAPRSFGFGNERSRPQHRMALAEKRVRIGYALVGAPGNPEHRFAAPDLLEREREPVDHNPVAA